MARITSDYATLDLPGIVRAVGRPCTGKAKSAAVRTREYRLRIVRKGGGLFPSTPISAAATKAFHELKALHPRLTQKQLLEMILVDTAKRWQRRADIHVAAAAPSESDVAEPVGVTMELF